MSLSSLQLDAFQEVARTGSFSKAAKSLHLTQSALSQRVLKLEDELGTTLMIREPSGLRLTAVGEELLLYCRTRAGLENEFMAHMGSAGRGALAGLIRIGGFSTVTRSVILPALRSLLKAEPGIVLELLTRESRELPGLLRTGEADFVLLDRLPERVGRQVCLLGREVNVLVEPAVGTCPDGVYIDHDAEDETTHRFMESQRNPARDYRRIYLDEIYSILDGVEAGLGRAVVPRHLAVTHKGIRIVPGYRAMEVPVYLVGIEQAYMPKLHEAVWKELRARTPALLNGKSENRRSARTSR